MSARAMAMRWRCPPDSLVPCSPTMVSYPSGSSQMNSCAPASLAASIMASTCKAGLDQGDVVADGAVEQDVFLQDHADLAAQRCGIDHGNILSIDQHPAPVRHIETLDQLGERAFAGTGTADDADHLAGSDFQVYRANDIRRVRAVAEGHLIELDGSGQPWNPGLLADNLGARIEDVAQALHGDAGLLEVVP